MTNDKFKTFYETKKNFTNSLNLLVRQNARDDFDYENMAATVHFYAMTFGLAWKLFRDVLAIQGIMVKSPQDSIPMAISMGFIEDGGLWIEMLEGRNCSNRIYNEELARALFVNIKTKFITPLEELRKFEPK